MWILFTCWFKKQTGWLELIWNIVIRLQVCNCEIGLNYKKKLQLTISQQIHTRLFGIGGSPSFRWLSNQTIYWIRWNGIFGKIVQIHRLCAIEIASNWNSIRFRLRTCPNFRFAFQRAWLIWFDGSLFLSSRKRLCLFVRCCTSHTSDYLLPFDCFRNWNCWIKSLKCICCSEASFYLPIPSRRFFFFVQINRYIRWYLCTVGNINAFNAH